MAKGGRSTPEASALNSVHLVQGSFLSRSKGRWAGPLSGAVV